MSQDLASQMPEAHFAAPVGINVRVLESLVDHLRKGTGLVDSPTARQNVALTLEHVATQAPHGLFAKVWDALYRALENPTAGGCHRKTVQRFLQSSEARRLRLISAVAQRGLPSGEEAYTLQIAQSLAKSALNPEHQAFARNVAAALTERLLPTSLRTVKGDRPSTTLFASAHQIEYFANVHGSAGPALLREIQGDAPGSKRYALGDTFASGTYGAIRAAMDESGRLYAAKVFRLDGRRTDSTTDVSEKLDVYQEIRVAQRVGSKLAPTDVLVVDDKAYVFTPLMGGDMLYMQIDTGDHPLYPALARKMFLDVAHDIKRCHDAGVLHRDVKLQNIMFNDEPSMTLGDFGLHHVGLSCKVDLEYPMGSEGYMAPELLIADPLTEAYGPKADVFSLGLCMVYMYIYDANDLPFYTASDPARMHHAVAEWDAWIALRSFRGHAGVIDWDEVRRHKDRLDRVALRFYNRDPELCTYVFEQLLRISPEERPTSKQVVEQAARMFTRYEPLAQDIGTLLRGVASKNKKLSATVHALRQRRVHQTLPVLAPALPQD